MFPTLASTRFTPTSKHAGAGFSLVELLVAISIVGVLVALLLSAIQAARETARACQCQNNLRQLSLSIHHHHDTFGYAPPGWSTGLPAGLPSPTSGPSAAVALPPVPPESEPGWAWSAYCLPYMEQNALAEQIDLQVSVAADRHDQVRTQLLDLHACPSDPAPRHFILISSRLVPYGPPPVPFGPAWHPPVLHAFSFELARSNYVGVFGSNVVGSSTPGDGIFYNNSQTRWADVKDGLSNTFLLGERSSRIDNSTWVGVIYNTERAESRVVGSAAQAPNDPSGGFHEFGSYHRGSTHFSFADGSVRRVYDTVDRQMYRAFATRDQSD